MSNGGEDRGACNRVRETRRRARRNRRVRWTWAPRRSVPADDTEIETIETKYPSRSRVVQIDPHSCPA